MQNETAIEIVGLDKWFGSFHVLRGVDLKVMRGERVVICGPSGSGKSTLLRCINRIEDWQRGRVIVDGMELTEDLKKIDEVRREVGMVFQQFNLFPHLTVLENVRVAVQGPARAFDFWSRADRLDGVRDRARALLAAVGLADKAALLAAHLSHGEKRHLEIGIALASDPALLLLDEPTAGMSPEETDETMLLIRELAAGRTVILVEHKMKLVMRISDRITVLHQGQVLAEGTPEEIRANEIVQQTYLGASR
ncbi:MAG TPA: ATP-binding cassette domain-containing protein [Gemmatimonadaceae bacterium]|nr:ATP-binding cassette domain-containing protein [Gemmatimonadaceae bacterium]